MAGLNHYVTGKSEKSDRYPLTSHTPLGQVHHLFLLAHALFIASSPHQLISSAHYCSECDSERNVHLWFYFVGRCQGHFRIGQTQNCEKIRRSIYASILQQRGWTLSLSQHTRKFAQTDNCQQIKERVHSTNVPLIWMQVHGDVEAIGMHFFNCSVARLAISFFLILNSLVLVYYSRNNPVEQHVTL
jgi:hypothetical protein